MDRQPNPNVPVTVQLTPEVAAAIAAFSRALDRSDPILAGFDMTPVAMLVSDPTLPDNPAIYINDGFERLTGFRRAEVLGRNCRFMQGPLTDPADVARLREAIAKRQRIEIDLLNHRHDGTPYWNRLMVAPVFAPDGEIRYFVASQIDVTIERHRVLRLEEERVALAAEIAQRDADLAEQNAKLRLALKAGSLGTWTLDLPERHLIASSSCKSNFGRPTDEPFTYEQFEEALHPDDRERVLSAIYAAIERGEPYLIDYRILTPAGEQRWMGIQGEVRRHPDGTPYALTGYSTDISDRKFAEEHRSVLANELTHRVKNTLATVGAVVAQTLRDATSISDAADTIAGRIASLATAHELLINEEVEGAAIGDIVERALQPFIDRGRQRFEIEGPTVRLSPQITLALSMVLYELATNAVKYGALSGAKGRVVVRWSFTGRDGDRHLLFSWMEEGGPPVSPPSRTGFGTRMIERMLRRYVQREAVITYPEDGVRLEIAIKI